ncbi:MAG TPA: hypothetical protein VGL89_00870 [Candidatus Koribacter sp.]|jgi:hypothetical protein
MTSFVSVFELDGRADSAKKPIFCALCHDPFPTEQKKEEHLERAHPNWAATMMSAYLRQTPRENG